jgi:hypothetical protein
MTTATATVSVISADELLNYWQGHRRLTRKTIEAFPEDKLFSFSVGGMRPFAVLAQEFIGMAAPIVDGVATGKWVEYGGGPKPTRKKFSKSGISRPGNSTRSFPPFRRTASPKRTRPLANGR